MNDGSKPEAVFRRDRPSGVRRGETLPPDLLREGVRRLQRLLVPAAVVMAISFATALWMTTRSGYAPGPLALWGAGARFVVVAAMFVLTRRKDMDPGGILDRALVFEVVMAFLIALSFHAVTGDPARLPRGISPVALWVLAHTLFVPSTPGKTVLSATAAALMDPLGLLVNVAAGVPMPPPLWLVGLFLPTALSAAIAIIGARVIYGLSLDVAREREMGSYRLLSPLGHGGMGEVWRAEHRLLARPAAVKLIRPGLDEGAGRGEMLARFKREARATAALRSPHTVQLYDFGVSDDGSFYYAMELLEGLTLAQLVERFGPVPAERAAHLLRQACASLEEAHRSGLIHRDIKPSNIFVCRYGLTPDFVKVLDFGLVKPAPGFAADPGLTVPGLLAGSPATMPPEVARGRGEIDARADLYSLACVGYWLLTGTHVFRQSTAMAAIHDHAATSPEPPSRRSGRPLPRELESLLMQCLEKDPARRPGSARAMALRLEDIPFERPWTEESAEEWWTSRAAYEALPTEVRLKAV